MPEDLDDAKIERYKNKKDKECFDNWVRYSLWDSDIKCGWNDDHQCSYDKKLGLTSNLVTLL